MPKFQKGQSGNPGGRKKIDPEVKKILETATIDAANALVDMVTSERTPPQNRLKAVEILFDRVYGKPQQSVEFDGDVNAHAGMTIKFEGELEEWSG